MASAGISDGPEVLLREKCKRRGDGMQGKMECRGKGPGRGDSRAKTIVGSRAESHAEGIRVTAGLHRIAQSLEQRGGVRTRMGRISFEENLVLSIEDGDAGHRSDR